jgi:hypothetical protein
MWEVHILTSYENVAKGAERRHSLTRAQLQPNQNPGRLVELFLVGNSGMAKRHFTGVECGQPCISTSGAIRANAITLALILRMLKLVQCAREISGIGRDNQE